MAVQVHFVIKVPGALPFRSLGCGHAAPLGDSRRAVKHRIVLEFVILPPSLLTADVDSICLLLVIYQAEGPPWVL